MAISQVGRRGVGGDDDVFDVAAVVHRKKPTLGQIVMRSHYTNFGPFPSEKNCVSIPFFSQLYRPVHDSDLMALLALGIRRSFWFKFWTKFWYGTRNSLH